MILRKPYAFLIKNFKIIHIILMLLLIFVVYKTTSIYTFFSQYADLGRYNYVNNLASQYINFFMYGAILLILIIALIIYFLMNSKEKPTKFYIATIVYYILVFIMLSVIYGVLDSLQTTSLTTQVARVYRDLIFLVYLPQYFFIFYSGLRATGFNIKKFNFDKDLEDNLEISEQDREEIEIVAPNDTYKVERKIRRFIREFYYYFKENTLIVSIIAIIIVTIIGTLMFFNRNVYNKEYRFNQSFTYKYFTLQALDASLTNIDYNGNVLLEDKYYLVIKLSATNNQAPSALDTDNFRLIVDNEYIYPTFSRNEYFIDMGKPYAKENINRKETKQILFIYEIPKANIQKEYQLRIVDKIDVQIGSIIPTYKELTIKPNTIDTISNKGNYILNNEINFQDSNILDTKLIIKNYEITNSYRYSYEYCYKEVCTPSYSTVNADNIGVINNTLLVIDYDLELATSDYNTSSTLEKDFFIDFMKIKYTINGNTKLVNFQNKTPNSFENKFFAQVNAEITNASNIELIFTVRNSEYVVKIK